MYANYSYYIDNYGGSLITVDEAAERLQTASDTIDTLTYCRIISYGFEALTDFQKGIIQKAVCQLAEWQYKNADILDNPYNSYSINGVSASWGNSAGVRKINGVLIPSSIYAELIKTGLCYAGVR